MFEYYNSINKITEDKYLEMHNILKADYINRYGVEKYNARNYGKESFNKWVDMLRNNETYNILLFIMDNQIVGFICYMFADNDLCLSEVQIRKEYQGKYSILKKMCKEVLDNTKNKLINEITATIDKNNINSENVFEHIGMVNTHNLWYEIDYNTFLKWVNK